MSENKQTVENEVIMNDEPQVDFDTPTEVPQETPTKSLEQQLAERRGTLEQDHLRLKEIEIPVLYEELKTRNLAAIKARMQHFITIKEIEAKYNRLVETDNLANQKAQDAQNQLQELMQNATSNSN